MANSMMSFVFTPTKNDYVKVLQANSLRQKSARLLIVVFIVISLCSIPYIFSGQSELSLYSIFPILCPLIIVFFIFYWQPYSFGRQVEANERLTCETKWNLTEKGIVVTTSYNEVKYDWGSFFDFVEINNYFLIFNSENQRTFQMVPKRAFQSPEQIETFREILVKKIRIPHATLKKSPWYVTYRLPIIIISLLMTMVIVIVVVNFITAMSK